MTLRVAELLAPIDQRQRALEVVVGQMDTAGWERSCDAEGWSVGVVAYHIARGFDRQVGFLEALLDGRGAHDYSWDETHALNADSQGARSPDARRGAEHRSTGDLAASGCDQQP